MRDYGEYRVTYYEPGLGWCNWIEPYPEGTSYRSWDTAIKAANECREGVDRSVRVWSCGTKGIVLVHEIRRLIDGKIENLPEG